ncbi:MAG: hypothetical protein U5L08_02140 [Xanthomonadales bacterium]|nr:hypothetical protein [Xanthomonadales bacterium]
MLNEFALRAPATRCPGNERIERAVGQTEDHYGHAETGDQNIRIEPIEQRRQQHDHSGKNKP